MKYKKGNEFKEVSKMHWQLRHVCEVVMSRADKQGIDVEIEVYNDNSGSYDFQKKGWMLLFSDGVGQFGWSISSLRKLKNKKNLNKNLEFTAYDNERGHYASNILYK